MNFLCWVCKANYLLNKDTYPRFEYEDGEGRDGLNAFIRLLIPRKVKIDEMARVENEIIASVERDFAGEQYRRPVWIKEDNSVAVGIIRGISIPVTEPVVADIPRPKRSKKKRVWTMNVRIARRSHPHKKIRPITGISWLRHWRKVLSALNSVTIGGGWGSYGFPDWSFASKYRSIRKAICASSEEVYVPEWTVSQGFGRMMVRLCAKMIDHFTPPAFFKTVRGMEHEQLFTEFNVSAARNLSLSSERRKGRLKIEISVVKAKEESAEYLDSELRFQVFELPRAHSGARLSDLECVLPSSMAVREPEVYLDPVQKLELFIPRTFDLKLETYDGDLGTYGGFQDN
ncbi:hypothetical protein Tco_0471083 [Tanacetum coccineum]